MIKFNDTALLRDVKTQKDGYKVIRASVVRTGVQGYLRSELGDAAPIGNPNDIIKIYRAPEEVFSDKAKNGWAHVPVTLDHPPELVTPDNYSQYAVGEVTSKARIDQDSGWFDMEMLVKDGRAITAQDSTHTQFSGGYTAEIVMDAGVTPSGEHYDGRQVNIDPNHMALVPNGRAFSDAAHTPHKWGVSPVILEDKEKPMDMKPIAIGDAVVNVALADADKITAVIDGLKQEVTDRDAAIGEHMATIKNLEAKVLTDEQRAQDAVELVAVIDRARMFDAKIDVAGKSPMAIKREALASMFDAAKVAEFPEAAVATMFDTLEPAKVDDSAREAIKSQEKKTVADGEIDWAAIQKKGAK